MNLQTWRRFFMWSTILNYAVLMIWFLAFVLARDWMHGFHGQWFRMTNEQFDLIHYGGMAIYKVVVLSVLFVPWLALTIMARKTAEER